MANLLTGNNKRSKSTDVNSKSERLNTTEINVYTGIVEAMDEDNSSGRLKVRIQELDGSSKTTPVFCNRKKNRGTVTKKLNKVIDTNDGFNNFISSVSIDSPLGEVTNKIKDKVVRSISDRGKNCSELPWAIPMSPLSIQSRPKVGELVMVIIFDRKNEQSSRVWSGPIIPSVSEINFSSNVSAKSILNRSSLPSPQKKISTPKVNDFTGSFPSSSDIAIMSRNNADIVLPSLDDKHNNITKGGEILLRAGKFKLRQTGGGDFILNDENIAYFRLKQLKEDKNSEKQPDTHAMLFADYISIVSHINGEEGTAPNIRKINPIDGVSTDDGIKGVHNSLEPLIRGGQLLEFLELLRDYVINHNHPYPKHPATNANSKPDIEKFDLNRLLSTNIRIN
jgi:hypothetical protein